MLLHQKQLILSLWSPTDPSSSSPWWRMHMHVFISPLAATLSTSFKVILTQLHWKSLQCHSVDRSNWFRFFCSPVMLPAASQTDPPVWLIQSPAILTFHFLIPFVIMMRPGPSCFISLAPEVFELELTSATRNIVRYAIIMKTITQFNNGKTSLQGDGAAASTVAQGQWPFCLEPVSSPCVCFSLGSLASSHSIKTH